MIATEDDILQQAQGWCEAARKVAVATVVETWGSAPRPVGSHLVVDSDGLFLGSVSGGCVESDVVAEAIEVIGSGASRLLEFGVADETAWLAGLSCGGRIKVYVESLDSMKLADLALFNEECRSRRPVALVTEIPGGHQRVVRAHEVADDPLATELVERFRLGKSGMCEHGERTLFLLVQVPRVRLVVVGAVHISQALAAMARLVELDVTVVDPRTAFATPERFPGTTLIPAWPDDVLPRLRLDAYTAVALLTHDPKIDDQALVAALKAGCFYVGALGSRKTHARRIERIRAEGFAEDDLARIRAPIGLDIAAVGPAEIAVAILGEIIASQRRKPFRSEKAA